MHSLTLLNTQNETNTAYYMYNLPHLNISIAFEKAVYLYKFIATKIHKFDDIPLIKCKHTCRILLHVTSGTQYKWF